MLCIGAISGGTVSWEVHPASAQNKSLLSDTVKYFTIYLEMDFTKRKIACISKR